MTRTGEGIQAHLGVKPPEKAQRDQGSKVGHIEKPKGLPILWKVHFVLSNDLWTSIDRSESRRVLSPIGIDIRLLIPLVN